MSAAEMITDLDDELIRELAPQDAPDDEAIQAWDGDLDVEPAAERLVAWRPQDVGSADWVARKAVKAKDAVAALQAQRDRVVAQADAWLAAERARHDRTVQWAEQMLAVWLTAEIEADDSKKPRKSRSLPAGVTVKQTAGRRKIEIVDEGLLVEWASAHADDLLNVKVTPDKRALAKLAGDEKLVTGDGEAVPGARATVGPDTVSVTYGGAA